MSGPEDAVALVKREIESSTDIDGISLTVDRLEPDQLVVFCQREGGPISVMPPLEPE